MQTNTGSQKRSIVKTARQARQAEKGQGGHIVLALSLSGGAIVLALIAGTILGAA